MIKMYAKKWFLEELFTERFAEECCYENLILKLLFLSV